MKTDLKPAPSKIICQEGIKGESKLRSWAAQSKESWVRIREDIVGGLNSLVVGTLGASKAEASKACNGLHTVLMFISLLVSQTPNKRVSFDSMQVVKTAV